VIARNAELENSSLFKPLPGQEFETPVGLPLDLTTTTTVQVVPGSYSG
jgi:hypothetical protein